MLMLSTRFRSLTLQRNQFSSPAVRRGPARLAFPLRGLLRGEGERTWAQSRRFPRHRWDRC